MVEQKVQYSNLIHAARLGVITWYGKIELGNPVHFGGLGNASQISQYLNKYLKKMSRNKLDKGIQRMFLVKGTSCAKAWW